MSGTVASQWRERRPRCASPGAPIRAPWMPWRRAWRKRAGGRKRRGWPAKRAHWPWLRGSPTWRRRSMPGARFTRGACLTGRTRSRDGSSGGLLEQRGAQRLVQAPLVGVDRCLDRDRVLHPDVDTGRASVDGHVLGADGQLELLRLAQDAAFDLLV